MTGNPVSHSFEAAADAVVAGNEAALSALLVEDPDLVHARSDRDHGAPLLVYTTANGVETFRQRIPPNVVRVAQVLLDAGAEVDATVDVYGAACTTLGLAATSGLLRDAGTQRPLLELLLDRGARIEVEPAGSTGGIVTACLGNGCSEAAAFLADRGARVGLVEAAGLGRLDVVVEQIEDGRANGQPLDDALLQACGNGHTEIAELLLGHGGDLGATTGDGQTPAHQAVVAGHLTTLTMLLEHRPPLEQRNIYGGTVLEQALWSAAHGANTNASIAIIDALLAAGAVLDDRHVPVGPEIDDHLAEHGSRREPTWYWFGEEPRSP
jgi:hypothetical protein